MDIVVTGRRLEVTDPIRDYALELANRLPRYYDRVTEVEVVVDKAEKNSYDVEVLAHVDGHEPFVAHGRHEDLYAGLDQTMDKMARQLTDHKEKLRNRKHPARE